MSLKDNLSKELSNPFKSSYLLLLDRISNVPSVNVDRTRYLDRVTNLVEDTIIRNRLDTNRITPSTIEVPNETILSEIELDRRIIE